MDEEFKFKVGDGVVIVNANDCVFGTNDSMRMLEGTVTTVRQCYYVTTAGEIYNAYKLHGNVWTWGENNLVSASIPFEESDFESILL